MKKKILIKSALLTSIVSTTLLLAQTPTALKSASAQAKTVVKADSTTKPDIGQRKFEANCGRCHTAPEQLSPSLTGTVVRHMRVRAILSAQDEKDILRYLAP
jgi:cytochrome c5